MKPSRNERYITSSGQEGNILQALPRRRGGTEHKEKRKRKAMPSGGVEVAVLTGPCSRIQEAGAEVLE